MSGDPGARWQTRNPMESSPLKRTTAKCMGSAVECPLSLAEVKAFLMAVNVASVIVVCSFILFCRSMQINFFVNLLRFQIEK
jgi:hypothetical protein